MAETITKETLLAQAAVIRDETVDAENKAMRIGTMFIDIINNLAAALEVADPAKDGLMSAAMVTNLKTLVSSVDVLSQEVQKKLDKTDRFVFPSSIDASVITPSPTRQFVSDFEKKKWNDAVSKIFWKSLPDLIAQLKIPTKVSELTNDKGFLTQHQDISHLAPKSSLPTRVGQLENDKGYLTRHQDINGKVDKEDGKSLMSDEEHKKLASVEGIVTIDDFIEVKTIGTGTSTENGKLVYDPIRNIFLWRVLYPSNPTPTFFANAEKCALAGTQPKLGVMYICGDKTYIGVAAGLHMQRNNFDVDIASVIEDADEIILRKENTEMRIAASDLRKYVTYDTVVEELK